MVRLTASDLHHSTIDNPGEGQPDAMQSL